MTLLYLLYKRPYIIFALFFTIMCAIYVTKLYITHKNSSSFSAHLFTPRKKINIQKVMDFPFTHIIKRYQKDYGVSLETALEHEKELKRWFIVAAEHDEPLDMFSPEVDDLWHTFLLFTKEYYTFCHTLLGKFIHHVPNIEHEINDSLTI